MDQAHQPDAPPAGAAICTIASRNFLPRVRTLARTLHRYHPDLPVYFLLADRAADTSSDDQASFTTVTLDELALPDLPACCFQYDCLELNTAVKPAFLAHLMERRGHDKVLYFDADIKFFDSIAPVLQALDAASFIVTPHLTGPLALDAQPSERDILLAGTYNLGFIGISNTPTAWRMLEWWRQRLEKDCICDAAAGLFVDQRWVDLVPGMFGETTVIRDPGCNVAYWNLAQRALARAPGGFTVNGEPLRFYHFSGFSPERTDRVSSHPTHYTVGDMPCLAELYADYAEDLREVGDAEARTWPYGFARFDDGTPIPGIARTIYRELGAERERFGDPFRVGDGSFFAWLNEPACPGDARSPVFTRLAAEIHRRRSDLQWAFPDPGGRDRLALARWMAGDGVAQYRLGAETEGRLADASFARWMTGDGAAQYEVGAPFLAALKLRGRVTGPGQRLASFLARAGGGRVGRAVFGERFTNRLRDRLLWGRRRG